MAHPLLAQLNSLLAAIGQQKVLDDTGNTSYVTVNIFKDEDLNTFLGLSEKAVLNVLKSTFDVNVTNPDLVVEHAAYLALTGRSLLEKGREYKVEDAGMYFDPPNLSDHMINVVHLLMDNWFKKVHLIRG